MKMSVYFFAPAIFLGALSLGFGCPSKTSSTAGPTAPSNSVSVLTVSPDPVSVGVGKSKQLNAVATFADGTKKDVSDSGSIQWTSDNNKTATVNEKGVVVGVGLGITKVKAEYEGTLGASTVTVTP